MMHSNIIPQSVPSWLNKISYVLVVLIFASINYETYI